MLPTRNNRSLVSNPKIENFLGLASIPTGRKAMLGDASKLPQYVVTELTKAHTALERLPGKIEAIIKDRTRPSDAEKHAAARTVGNQTIAPLLATQQSLRDWAKAADNSSQEAIDGAFKPDPLRQAIEVEQRAYIRDLASKPDGVAKIRELVMTDREAAAVFSFSPPHLLGLAADVKKSIHLSIVEKYIPEAVEFAEQAKDMEDAADKYDGVIANVKGTWFDAVADGVETRVDLND